MDLWTNRQMKSFVGITFQFIDKWIIETGVLACRRMKGKHTGDNIKLEFEETVSSFEISQKAIHLTTDGAQNIIKAFKLPDFNVEEQNSDENSEDVIEAIPLQDINIQPETSSCICHTLQLVIKDGFNNASKIRTALSKTSNLVSHIRRSIYASELLEDEKRVQQSNTTCWNSQLKMVRSVLAIPSEKLDFIDSQYTLNRRDRSTLEDMVEILSPFESATEVLQADKSVTSSLVIPIIHGLRPHLNAGQNQSLTVSLLESLDKRLKIYENDDRFITATMLDSRFKHNFF